MQHTTATDYDKILTFTKRLQDCKNYILRLNTHKTSEEYVHVYRIWKKRFHQNAFIIQHQK